MKEIIKPEISKFYCDLTGRELSAPESSLHLSYLTRPKGTKRDIDYDWRYLKIDVCGEVALEIINFLRRKYPNFKTFSDFKQNGEVLEAIPDIF